MCLTRIIVGYWSSVHYVGMSHSFAAAVSLGGSAGADGKGNNNFNLYASVPER